MKKQVGKASIWKISNFTKWQDDDMSSWPNGKLMKWHFYKRQVGEMPS